MPDWIQHVIVGLAAVAAGAWLIRDRRRRRAAKSACDSCALVKPPEN